MPGWTLAADVSAAVPGLLEVLDDLDDEVAAVGGRLYLAKDSRQKASMFKRTYKKIGEFRKAASNLNTDDKLFSSMMNRLA